MERSEILTFQMPLPNSGAVATAGIPVVQILFTDLDRDLETLEHKMSWSFASVTDATHRWAYRLKIGPHPKLERT
jgi:hypothetical protein